jgi:hypothetical protein
MVQGEHWLTLVASRRLREADRIRDGFLELPHLMITSGDAARLWGIDEGSCEELLNVMVADGFLVHSGGRYRRA